GVREHGRVDVDHDLIALARGARIDAVVERRFREQGERIRLLLLDRRLLLLDWRRFRGNVVQVVESLAPLLVQSLASCGQRLQEHRAGFRRQPPADDHHAVFVRYTRSARRLWRRAVSRASAIRSTRRQPRTIRSTWQAVPARPTASRRSSVSGVATRVSARTLAYESSPRARACASRGKFARARATRTRSRAAPRSSPTR